MRDDSRASAAYAEKTTLRRALQGVSQSRRVATTDTRVRTVPRPGSGIWTGFPFGVTVAHKNKCLLRHHTFDQGFPSALGSTDSCSTAVHTKPFSTSALQGLSGVFATTTKICTGGGSSQVHTQKPFAPPPRPSYSSAPRGLGGPALRRRPGMSGAL